MAIQIQGNGGTVAEVDGTTFRAQRVTSRPLDYGAFGHYQIAAVTGTLPAALAAGTGTAGHVFAFRWGDATRLAVIYYLITQFQTLTAFTAATLTDYGSFDAFILRSYTASHAAGTDLTPTGNNAKLRTSMGTSLLTSARISTTAALTAGTHTFDAFAFAQSIEKGDCGTTATTLSPRVPGPGLLYAPLTDGRHPIVLAQNEGIVIRNRTVWPAAGTGVLRVEINWAEVSAY